VLTRSRSERCSGNHISVGTTGPGTAAGRTGSDNGKTEPVNNVIAPPQSPLSEDLSVLWHELLSPVNLIQAYTSTLLQMNHAITGEQRIQYIKGIDSASNRLVRLLENLRDISRMENAEILRDQTIALYELLQKVLGDMQAQTQKHAIKLHLHAPLPRVRVAPEKIEQLVTNLIANAMKYSPNGGDIDVDIRFARSSSELAALCEGAPAARTPCYVVSVADQGVGIPQEDLPHIFEKFYRANHKQVRSSPGAGLGLYICKIITEAHGGLIWAANRDSGGSIFRFSIPLDMDERQRW
jgi:two-component system sensor histidine kinase KdpD